MKKIFIFIAFLFITIYFSGVQLKAQTVECAPDCNEDWHYCTAST
jgi:hypothetical protein